MSRRAHYNRQTMQKLTIAANTALSTSGASIPVTLTLPEEVIVKRIVASCVVMSDMNNTAGVPTPVPFELAVVQADEAGALQVNDYNSPQRLVKKHLGTAMTPVNIDHTITMRKLAGSTVGLVLINHTLVSPSKEFYVALTIHYLES